MVQYPAWAHIASAKAKGPEVIRALAFNVMETQ
jgi:hypothetical protein